MTSNPKIIVTVRVEGATAATESRATLHIEGGGDDAIRSLLGQTQEMADSCTDMLADSIAIVPWDPLS